MVTLRKPFLVVAFLALVCGLFAYKVNADDWNKATLITTNQPIEVPGRILPAGKYMFKLMDTIDRHVVQIMSDDQSKLYQTVLAIPDYRAEATDNAAITFYETPAGQVSPVRSWFYAGERSGVEFVYPKGHGALAATVAENTPPPSQETVAESTVTVAKEEPAPQPEPEAAIEQPTEQSEVEIAQNTVPETPAVKTEETAPATEAAPSSLPRTASPDELFLLIGLGSAFAAWGVRRLRS
jgi:hypothetical protein